MLCHHSNLLTPTKTFQLETLEPEPRGLRVKLNHPGPHSKTDLNLTNINEVLCSNPNSLFTLFLSLLMPRLLHLQEEKLVFHLFILL